MAGRAGVRPPTDHSVPRFHRLWTWNLAHALTIRPNHQVRAFTWGPISIMWDRSFKQAEAKR